VRLTVRDVHGAPLARLVMQAVDLIGYADRYLRQRGAAEA